ncbi:MAG: DUF4192 domain-containing protein, partial [Streptomyces sp.]|nr:DUF4192 domain-containing protein [Streptomyces sp.]
MNTELSFDSSDSLDRAAVPRISGPAELAQAIPYLLGFHPLDSLVVVGLARGRLVVTARIDLADAPVLAAETIAAMVRGGGEEFIVAVYDAAAEPHSPVGPLPWAEVAMEVVDHVEATG